MEHPRARQRELATLVLVLGLAATCGLPGRTLAAGPTAPPQPSSRPPRTPTALQHPGSAGNPIPIAGTEINAALLGPARPSDHIAMRIGSLTASLFGVPEIVLSPAGGPDPAGDLASTVVSNVYSGASIETAVGRSGGLYLGGGRVSLRDPIDIIGWGGTSSEYWTSSAGFEVRF
jgi:hypothetical protein